MTHCTVARSVPSAARNLGNATVSTEPSMNAIDDAITQVVRMIRRRPIGSSRPSSRGQGSAFMTPRAHGSTNGCAIRPLSKISSGPTTLLSGVRPLTTGGRRAAQPARHRTAGKQPILVAITRDLLTYTGLGAEPVQGF